MGKRQDDQASRSGERREKGNLYEEVTARVVAELEQGRVPWVQPWGAGKAALGLPRNGLSGQSYSGINILILWGAVIEGGYPSQFWLTYRQALALGWTRSQGRAGCQRLLCGPLHAHERDRAGRGGRRRAELDPVSEALHRLQRGAVRRFGALADSARRSLAGTDGA